MGIQNFILTWVKHEKSFITSDLGSSDDLSVFLFLGDCNSKISSLQIKSTWRNLPPNKYAKVKPKLHGELLLSVKQVEDILNSLDIQWTLSISKSKFIQTTDISM